MGPLRGVGQQDKQLQLVQRTNVYTNLKQQTKGLNKVIVNW